MKKLLAIVVATGTTYQVQAYHFEIGDVPDWVKPAEIPENSNVQKYDVAGGSYPTVFDEQRNLVDRAVFTHVALKVLTSAGVQSVSEVAIEYDTAYKHVDFHYLYIYRNGERIDRTNDLTFEFLRNEGELNTRMYTGRVTAYDILDDIRKGDIVEYAYTITGENPIFEGKQFDFLTFEMGNPVDILNYRVVHNKTVELNKRCHKCDGVSVNEFDRDDFHIIELSKANLKATEFEQSIPPWELPYSHYSYSTSNSWKEIDDWAKVVFELEESTSVNELVKEFKKAYKKLPDRIDAAINYAQDEIRYMGLENGIGSIKPFPPSKVIEQRYGDCKDKSLLLATLLKSLGVEKAHPALVNARTLRGVEKMLPAGQVFDHCILYFNYEGQDYWVDPTIPLQGGSFRNLTIPDFGVALIVGDETTGLVKMNIQDTVSRVEIFEEFTFANLQEPATFTVETKHYGSVANSLRAVLEYVSRNDISDDLRQNYGRVFTGIQKDELIEIEDDEEKNIITTRESYLIDDPWRKIENETYQIFQFRYEPIELYNYIGQSECEIKNHPVYIPYPTKLKQKTVLNLPDNLPIEEEHTKFDNEGFSYVSSIIPSRRKSIELNYDFATKADNVKAEDFTKVCKDMNDISGQIALTLTFSRPNLNSEEFLNSVKEFKLEYFEEK